MIHLSPKTPEDFYLSYLLCKAFCPIFSSAKFFLVSQETSDIYRLTDFEFTEHMRIFSL